LALLLSPDPTKQVKAQYPHFEGQKVCIIVRADGDTLFEFPQVQFELSEHMRVALDGNVPKITFVANRQIVDWQVQQYDWQEIDPAAIATRFKADELIEIDLSEYTLRDPTEPQLLRGTLSAMVRVYSADRPDAAAKFSKYISVRYPDGPVGTFTENASLVRRRTMELFAEQAGRLFYDHEVKM
jgi:hypothetical protein